jgi:hypothetical protein
MVNNYEVQTVRYSLESRNASCLVKLCTGTDQTIDNVQVAGVVE